jgi:hypothetical protein
MLHLLVINVARELVRQIVTSKKRKKRKRFSSMVCDCWQAPEGFD